MHPHLGIFGEGQLLNRSPGNSKGWWSLANLFKGPRGCQSQWLQELPGTAKKQLNVGGTAPPFGSFLVGHVLNRSSRNAKV